MRARIFQIAACSLSLVVAAPVVAQNNADGRPLLAARQPMIERAPPPGYTMGSPPAIEPGPNYFHASTIQQGVLDGAASVIRAEGQATYNIAVAAEHFEAARQAAIRNDLMAADARYQYRQMVRDYRQQTRGPRITHEEATRIAQLRAPQRLSGNDVDRWGRINWPTELTGEQFAADRKAVQELFVTAAGYGAEDLRHDQVKPIVDRMLATLHESQTKMPAGRYIVARRFLKGLDYEARISGDDVRLAQR